MKIGLIGDIHGNQYAMDAVLGAAKNLGVEKLLITGDVVGYYFSPKRVLEQLSNWNYSMVRGNHEDMLKIARSSSQFLADVGRKYGPGLQMAIETLAEDQLDMLCNLPHPLEISVDARQILLCHGSPLSIDSYIYPDAEEELFKKNSAESYDLVVMGHTHYPMARQVDSVLYVNPGSVGQPRNGIPGANWATYDTKQKTVQFFCEQYPADKLLGECNTFANDFPYLANILTRK